MAVTQFRGANNGVGTSQIKSGSISNADIHASAAIALSKLAAAVIQANGGQAFTNDQSMGGFKLINLADGTASTDAVTKGQLDAVAAGLDYKEAARVATTAVLSGTMIANNGTPATGERSYNTTAKTITWFTGEGPTAIDGVTLANGNRILVKNETSTSGPSGGEGRQYNGIYVRTSQDVWTRASDHDGTPTNEISTGNAVFIVEGTANATTGWVLSTTNAADPDNINVNTETKNFTQFNAASTYTASNGITLAGNDFQLNLTGLSTATIVAADEIAFADSSDSNTEKKTTFANFEAALTLDNQLGTLSVGKGGTGATTLTSNGVLYGNGTSAIAATTAGAANTILYSNAGTPAFTSNVFVTQSATDSQFYSNASSSVSLKATATGASLLANTANHGSGASGDIFVATGTGTANSGAIALDTGTASGGNTGAITVTTGNAASGNSGNIVLATGTASSVAGVIRFQVALSNVAEVQADGLNLYTGNTYQINNVSVLSSTTLGSSVVTSSLTAVGTLTSGAWNATTIGTQYGGTGLSIVPTTINDGDLLIGDNAGDAFVKATLSAGTGISITNGGGSITISVAAGVVTTSDVVVGETPSGTINGTNDTFTIANSPVTGTVAVYLNGQRTISGAGNDYTISGTTITFEAGQIPQTGDTLRVDYIIA